MRSVDRSVRRVKYIIFVIDSQSNTAVGNEMAAIDAFNEGLQRDGYWVMAAGIGAPNTATVIDNRRGVGLLQSGSLFAESEHYSGFGSLMCRLLRLPWSSRIRVRKRAIGE